MEQLEGGVCQGGGCQTALSTNQLMILFKFFPVHSRVYIMDREGVSVMDREGVYVVDRKVIYVVDRTRHMAITSPLRSHNHDRCAAFPQRALLEGGKGGGESSHVWRSEGGSVMLACQNGC